MVDNRSGLPFTGLSFLLSCYTIYRIARQPGITKFFCLMIGVQISSICAMIFSFLYGLMAENSPAEAIQLIRPLGWFFEVATIGGICLVDFETLRTYRILSTSITDYKLNVLLSAIAIIFVPSISFFVALIFMAGVSNYAYYAFEVGVILNYISGLFTIVYDAAQNAWLSRLLFMYSKIRTTHGSLVRIRFRGVLALIVLIVCIDVLAILSGLLSRVFPGGTILLADIALSLVGIHASLQVHLFFRMKSLALSNVKIQPPLKKKLALSNMKTQSSLKGATGSIKVHFEESP